jgi:hypothetical protein
MMKFGKTGQVHAVKYNPKTNRNDVFFGPKGTKAGHAVVDGRSGGVEYLRGAGKNVKASRDTGKYLRRG